MSVTVEPFTIAVPQADLDDLARRLAATRWPEDPGNADWTYGVERGWLEEMVSYWREKFDWRAQEAEMNRFPHFRAEIDGVPIHFMHIRSKNPNPTPLILTHGWPWTFWDFHKLIGPLTDPLAHGGKADDSFDLVIPSLPGFGFSTPLGRTGVDAAATAQMWAKLMAALGYDRFAAAGADFGATVTAYLGHAHDERVTGIYASMAVFPGLDRSNMRPSDYAPDEQWMVARAAEAAPKIASHWTVHRLDPQTLAYGLTDSPVGTAAWIWERRRAWSDCGGDLLRFMTRDELCTLASLYWLTGAIGSSMRFYWEQFNGGLASKSLHDRQPAIAVPSGFAIFPKDVVFVPRAAMAAATNLKRWTAMPAGGHFGPIEQPALFVDELRTFFREQD